MIQQVKDLTSKFLFVPEERKTNRGKFIPSRLRLSIGPRLSRSHCQFSSRTFSWLSAHKQYCVVNKGEQAFTCLIPEFGITDRAILPDYDNDEIKYFKTIIKITVPAGVNNLDQCVIELGPRLFMEQNIFERELFEEFAKQRSLQWDSNLTIYTQDCFNSSVVTDLDTFRLGAIKGSPVINLDWKGSKDNWSARWSILGQSEPALKEKTFFDVIDDLIYLVGASDIDVIVYRTKSYFDSQYLPYRFEKKLARFKTLLFAHPNIEEESCCYQHWLDGWHLSSLKREINGEERSVPSLSINTIVKDTANRTVILGAIEDLSYSHKDPTIRDMRQNICSTRYFQRIEGHAKDKHSLNYGVITAMLNAERPDLKTDRDAFILVCQDGDYALITNNNLFS